MIAIRTSRPTALPTATKWPWSALEATVEKGQPLFTVYAEASGELAYALDYVNANPDIVRIEEAR